MAGSWNHMTTAEAKLVNNEIFCDMIENLGDAYEAAEDCFGMIWWLADQLARVIYDPGTEEPAPRAFVLGLIEQAAAAGNVREGIARGGRLKPR